MAVWSLPFDRGPLLPPLLPLMKVRTGRLAAVTLLSDGSTEEDEEVAWVEAVVVIAAARAAVRGDVGVGGGVGAGVVTGGGGTAARVSSKRRAEM